MKKLVIGTFAALFLLVGCGQKKETAASTTESSQEALQSTISERGLDEAKKALKEAEDKDESVQAARKISGFTIETTLLNEKEMETKTSYDFQTLDLKKASENEYLKNVGLENLLKNEPEDYIANRVANGATVQFVGYVLSGDPAYVPRYNNARNQIRKYERDEIVEELVRYYLKGQGVDL